MRRSATWLIASGLTLGALPVGCNQSDDVVAQAAIARGGDAGQQDAGGDAGKLDKAQCEAINSTYFYLEQITKTAECRLPQLQDDPKVWAFVFKFVNDPRNQPDLRPETRMPDACDAIRGSSPQYPPVYPISTGMFALCKAYCDHAKSWLADPKNIKAIGDCQP